MNMEKKPYFPKEKSIKKNKREAIIRREKFFTYKYLNEQNLA